ncbi:DUF5979 domain-containing protein [Schaalia suimastitidis]|uniref:DUF5979 domain-containing protein n=1 Tax=Schaalia suimastitidis TaxID=121163 RepID=UPI0004050344|nr:DUF5979 domain-containing protein [Schaalia suimastitidis]
MFHRVDGNRFTRRAATVFAMLLIALLVTIGSVFVATPAQAADDPNISFLSMKLDKTDASGNVLTGALAQWNIATLAFQWQVPQNEETNIQAGDSFSIQFPAELTARVPNQTKPFKVVYGGEEVEVGTCLILSTSMECTFDDFIPSRVADQGWKNFGGSGTLQLVASQTTTEEVLTFTTSGTPSAVTVDLPGTGGITAPISAGYTALDVTKGMYGISEASKNVTYPLGFNTKKVAEHFTAAGMTMTFDGVTNQTLTFVDTLGPGQTFSDPATWSFRWMYDQASFAQTPRPAPIQLATGSGVAMTTDKGTFTVNVELGTATPDGQSARISITGPFEKEVQYELLYTATPTASTNLLPGVTYGNAAKLVADVNNDGVEDTLRSVEVKKSFIESFSMSVTMEPAYGTFKVLKTLEGPGSTLISPTQTYRVKVDYTLPMDASSYHPNDTTYPGGWEAYAPGTLNADNRTGTAYFDVTQGKQTLFLGQYPPITFPRGTVVTLSEVTSASAAPAGYRWATPVFKVGSATTNTFTIGDETITSVELTNRLEQINGTFTVSKTLNAASQAGAGKTFTFAYACNDLRQTTGTITGVPADGSQVASNVTLPVNTQCTISENAATAAIDGYDLAAPASQTVTITEPAAQNPAVNAAFENNYTRQTGSFSVAKTVTGDLVGDATQVFPVTYVCNDASGTTGKLQLTGDGARVQGPTLPVGTNCTITEDPVSLDGYAITTSYSASAVTITKDSNELVTVTNAYKKLAGGLTVTKSVTGNGAALAPSSFTFTYTCSRAGAVVKEGSIELNAANNFIATVADMPVGTCELSEDDARVAGADVTSTLTMGTTSVTDAPITFEVTDGSSTAISATNTYTRHKVSVGNYVWFDANGDGLQDATDEPMGGVTLALTGPNGQAVVDIHGNPVAPAITDVDGRYLFENLPTLAPGESYTVTVTDTGRFGYVATLPDVGADRSVDSSDTAASSTADLSIDGAEDLTLDFGFVKAKVSVGDFVWLDTDRDGKQDDDEPGLGGVTLTVTGPDGNPVTDVYGNEVTPVKTDENGKYSFDNLPLLPNSQSYRVSVTTPDGYLPTRAGADDTTREDDSSDAYADSEGLNTDGDRDATLDFGFVAIEKPAADTSGTAAQPVTRPSNTKGALASTGTSAPIILGGAVLAAILGGTVLVLRRKQVK